MSEPPTYTVAEDLNEMGGLREVIDALRADNGRLLRLLITGFVSDGRPQPKGLTEALGPSFQLAELAKQYRMFGWQPK